jgi:biotin transport system substrate-specific component
MTKSQKIVFETGLVISGSILIALLSQLSVILPFSPVPLTGQTFGVFLIAVLFGAKRSAATMMTYLTEGLCGLPVFSKAGFGVAHLIGPSGGYLIGFLLAVYFIGYLSDRGYSKNFYKMSLMLIAGNLLIYICGCAWLSVFLGIKKAIICGAVPFIAGDLIKIMLISGFIPASWKVIKK